VAAPQPSIKGHYAGMAVLEVYVVLLALSFLWMLAVVYLRSTPAQWVQLC